MARPLRISFENAFYHIISRGNRKEKIFYSERDKYVFCDKMNETFEKYSFVCYAYCLMDNHYHLFIQTPFANISEGMHYLNASYANWFRVKYKLTGSVFQGRYKSILVDADSYALSLSAYIHLNPLRAGITEDIYQYKFSSFLSYAGVRKSKIKALDVNFILDKFDYDMDRASKKYVDYVLKGDFSIISDTTGDILGDESFVNKIRKLSDKGTNREIPAAKRLNKISYEIVIDCIKKVLGINENKIFEKKRGNLYRKIAIYLIKRYTEMRLSEIGDMFGMDYAAVSQMCFRFEKEMDRDERVKETVDRVIEKIRESGWK